MHQPFRIEPALPVHQYKTFQVTAPVQTHHRPARCEEVACDHQANGWASAIDESTDLGKQQAHYIRNQSGRRYRENRQLMPGVTVFEFEAGQQCFQQHTVPLDRPALYVVRGGDWRGNPTGEVVRHRPADWVEQFAAHQSGLAEAKQKG